MSTAIAAHAGAPIESDSDSGYRMPPAEIASIVDMPPEPSLSFSPCRKHVIQLDNPPSNPPVSELARPELKLGGLRIDPVLNSRSRMSYYTGMSLVAVDEDLALPAKEGGESRLRPVAGIPDRAWLNYVSFSPEGTRVAFSVRSPGERPDDPARKPLELYVGDVETCEARKVLGDMNVIFDDYVWLDEDNVLACTIPKGRGPAPTKPEVPTGPKIQTSSGGGKAQARTYADLLKDEHDERLFEYYGESELTRVNLATGETTTLGPKRLYTFVLPSPDGKYLLVSYLKRPFSFLVPCGRFPKVVELWDVHGNKLSTIADLPLAEDIPIAFNSCRKGPRQVGWRDDKPATLYWAECQDGGDPAVEASPRDIVYTMTAEESAQGKEPTPLVTTDFRYNGIGWCDGDLAMVYESWWKTRRSVVRCFAPDTPMEGRTEEVLFDRNYEDVYSDPGVPLTRKTEYKTSVLLTLEPESEDQGRRVVLLGQGATPEGYRPFVDVMDLKTRKKQRVWRCTGEQYERVGTLMNDEVGKQYTSLDGMRFLYTTETVQDPPQHYFFDFAVGASATGNGNGDGDGTAPSETVASQEGEEFEQLIQGEVSFSKKQITYFPHPYPTLKDLQKKVLRYKRDDGVDLTATLFTPPGYDKDRDGPLPCIMWAYPREFKSRDAAGQMRRSPHQFSGVGSLSPKLWLTRGYAILDGPTMPIIGEDDEEANDRYVEQLTASARAAVDHVVELGFVDRARVAVGGHSYGAFMTANLLAHCGELFACGLARSGAYNRTLTPFGFQAEERTLWQAPETYTKMSPFMHADKIKKPLLLIHGEDDPNPGTYSMQSERFFSALKGHGVESRLVLLPHEGHGYRAHESIMHTLFEMDAWLQKHCEHNKPGEDADTDVVDAETVSAAAK
ncbi:unnamed protein product [Pedinophyceae sp. YPF-701]|nr:unnamed protein product [Pedinophyceae sp. YPF-701]